MAVFIYFHLVPPKQVWLPDLLQSKEKRAGNVKQTLIKSLILLIKISGQTLSDSRDQIWTFAVLDLLQNPLKSIGVFLLSPVTGCLPAFFSLKLEITGRSLILQFSVPVWHLF